MIFLPTKLRQWYTNKASSRGLMEGEVIYFILRRYAEDQGFKCDHPLASHVLHEKGNNKIWRCSYCGLLFYKHVDKKLENGQIVDKTVITPRIEEL